MIKSKCPECGALIDACENSCEKCGYVWFDESIYVDKKVVEKSKKAVKEKIIKSVKEIKKIDLKKVEKLDIESYTERILKRRNRLEYKIKSCITKKNVVLASFLLAVMLLFGYSVYRYLNKEDKYIFKDVYFGMSYYQILQEEESNVYEKEIDIYEGRIIYTYDDVVIDGVKGSLSYCFSNNDKKLVKVIFKYENNSEDNKTMKRYVKGHFGIGKEDDSIGYVRYGKTLNYYFSNGKCKDIEQVVVETTDK